MQVTFTTEQLAWVRTGVSTLSTLFTLWALVRQGFNYLRDSLHVVITQNVNRVRDENQLYLDAKFKDHEVAAFNRLDLQDVQIDKLVKAIEEINKKLSGKST